MARAKMTGARLSPRHKLAAAMPYVAGGAAPPTCAMIPQRLDYWGNDQYGDCVTAEEAFAKACADPEIFVPAAEVERWARGHGVLNGADLAEVLDAMTRDGFAVGGQTFADGGKLGVDWSNEALLQAAISDPRAAGPVKIAIDASALPAGAGDHSGWYAFGSGRYQNTDHCVALCGYGPAGYCFGQLNEPIPSGVDPNKPCYLLFTWSTIGVVDHDWIMSTCQEAWTRHPTTPGLPAPPAPQPPGPAPSPAPVPPPAVPTLTLPQALPAGSYQLILGQAGGPGRLTPQQWQQILALILQLLPLIIPVLVPPAPPPPPPAGH